MPASASVPSSSSGDVLDGGEDLDAVRQLAADAREVLADAAGVEPVISSATRSPPGGR